VTNLCLAQRERLDSLKKVLPYLHDSARVDCLNTLSEGYLNHNNDTASYYAGLAFEEAVKINYIHGKAESISYKGEIELSDNFPGVENLSREAINLFRKTSNKKRLAATYLNLGFALYAQSFFVEAVKNLDTAYELYKKNGNASEMSHAISIAGAAYEESGNYEKAFELYRKSLDIAMRNNDDWIIRFQLRKIGQLFGDIGDYKTALIYYRRAFVNLKSEEVVSSFGVVALLAIAELFTYEHQYDSAKYYYGLIDTSNQRALRFYLKSIGEFYFVQKQYSKALPNFVRALEYHRQSNDRNPVMQTLLDIAKTYLALRNDDSAFLYVNQGLSIARQSGAKQFVRDGFEILSSLHEHRRQPDSAYFYYKQYTILNDSVLNDLVKGKLAAYTFEDKIELLNKEKQIQQTKLQKQTLLKNTLLVGVIILLVIAAIVFRNIILKRRNEKMRLQHELELHKLESEKQLSELEMQALRAQMNPHFIFNSLNSINRFILQNNRAQASEYLTKFSKLVRMILQNSQASLISLESELESLELYLQMETLRFDFHFSYKISVPKDLDIDLLKVPPLIIQPYVENAIWHGLMHKEEKGQLDIEVSQEDGYLYFKISDNGIGRKQAAALASKSATKHKSMGLRITADRIAMMQRSNGTESPVTINDLVNGDGSAAGTEVRIKIPVIQQE
jgi:tetratricopeptide (TPR) repeat protein